MKIPYRDNSLSKIDINPREIFEQEIRNVLDPSLHEYLGLRDGAATLTKKLPELYSAHEVATEIDKIKAWERVGLYYLTSERFYEAINIFLSLYGHLHKAQNEDDIWYHKAMPLVWVSHCYRQLNCPVLSKRYLMLTLVDDSIRDIGDRGGINVEEGGVYFPLVWTRGMKDEVVREYARKIYCDIYEKNEVESRYPEYVLQELGDEWNTEYPTSHESGIYDTNGRYISHLIEKLGNGSGKELERLADYILSCMPGCRTNRRMRTPSTDHDVVCSMQGVEIDYRSELGRYFVCECKDWEKPASVTVFAKMCYVLDSLKSRFGILFSKNGLSGAERNVNASHEQQKVFQHRGIVIVVVDHEDLKALSEGKNFISMLRSKYEKVRLDLV
jgi:hypothetical protein